MIGNDVIVTVLGLKGSQVRIGISAPKHIGVYREEIHARIQERRSEGILDDGAQTLPAVASSAAASGGCMP